MKNSVNNCPTCPTCGAPLLFPLRHGDGFEDLVALYLDDLAASGRSSHYLRCLQLFFRDYISPFFRSCGVDIRTVHIHRFYHVLCRRRPALSTKTIKHILDSLRAFINYLAAMELIERVPRFPRVKVVPSRPRRWLDAEAQARILTAIAPEHRLIFRVLFETGCRPSEVCALQVRDLSSDGVFIARAFDERGYLKSTKTGASFLRPLSARTLAQCHESARLALPGAWLFRRAPGEPYTARALYRIWRRAAAATGYDISLYEGVRHSRASQRRAELEAELRRELAATLGHESARTTLAHYALGGDRRVGVGPSSAL